MMGNKKIVKKTKEISSMSGEFQQQQGPRKRGRPRKIVPKAEGDEVVNHRDAEEEVVEGETKRAKISGGEKGEESEDKEEIGEGVAGSSSLLLPSSQKLQPRRRARRKGKPRKSC
ncbi:unnamed protein product [Cuscuta epithymum]|uniref:Uncharacterized protein n=1 Tax=Cuscuta epithymum TaxID=186058 RepID=A0AAV0CMK6_9ASTE|nr:unnamed protein product [Cuscuta epithymum]CAH9131818.1 unnamed protein product [Cuscuta epithymum]